MLLRQCMLSYVTYTSIKILKKKREDISPSLPTHEVPKDVEAIEIWGFTSTVDVTSSDRFPHCMAISIDWQNIICPETRKKSECHG